jgi:CBS domain-containing protein
MTLAHESMSRRVIVVPPDLALSEAYRLMTGGRIRHLLVMKGLRLLGIVSDRDVLVRAVLRDDGELDIPATPVEDAMTRSLVVCRPDTPVLELVQTMIEQKIDALPVVGDEDRLVGLVTTTDLLLLLTSTRESNAPPPFDYEIEQPKGSQ